MSTLIIIPSFNAGSTVGDVIDLCKQYGKPFLIDDGSIDNTFEVATKAGILCTQHPFNRGKGAAIRTGLEETAYSNFDAVVTIDADMQHSPDRIPDLVKPIIEGKAEIVIGSRYMTNDKETPSLRRVGQKVLDKLLYIAGGKALSDSQSGYRCFSPTIVKELLEIKGSGFEYESNILIAASKKGWRVLEVPVNASYEGDKCHTMNPVMHGMSVFCSLLKQVIKTKVVVS